MIVGIDIEKCFDEISHEFIMNKVARFEMKQDLHIQVIHEQIITSWLKQGYIDIEGFFSSKEEVQPTNAGVPQGGPISPTIMNMVMNGIQTCIKLPPPRNKTSHRGGRTNLEAQRKIYHDHKEHEDIPNHSGPKTKRIRRQQKNSF